MSQLREQIQAYISMETTYHMDAYDMEDIAEKVYGVRIEMLGSDDDVSHKYTVNGEQGEEDKKKLEKAIKNGYLAYRDYGVILNDLHNRQLIEKGMYFLHV